MEAVSIIQREYILKSIVNNMNDIKGKMDKLWYIHTIKCYRDIMTAEL